MASITTFSLTELTNEIRRNFPKYASIHDDYLCMKDWANMVSFYVTNEELNFEGIAKEGNGDIGILATEFLQRVFKLRKDLLIKHSNMAEINLAEFKKRVAELTKTEPELIKFKDLASTETTTVFGLLTTMPKLHTAINLAYKTKAESDKGAYCKHLGEVLHKGIEALMKNESIPIGAFYGELEFLEEPMMTLQSILKVEQDGNELRIQFGVIVKALLTGSDLPVELFSDKLAPFKEPIMKLQAVLKEAKADTRESLINQFTMIAKITVEGAPFPLNIFTGETKTMREPLARFAALFSAVKPPIRVELVGLFGKMMRSILECFMLYRLQVTIVPGQKPIFLSRFISSVLLSPFAKTFGVEMTPLTIIP